ncbi:enoyl-CoA hydratase/isomerase family protein [Cupriavidus pauculus]|uniref:Enoyl-CoA hydratase/isomerase family protein n=1 Tax=Cupriavidus pauculus TaxID=82633 RepID=A0A2N5C8I9_9BURK|nr:enoyl-CoA hydratase/isomerase family protein [Cupriavidus pauculus]PLP98527.1 enoyl-CoA hydratase/isomerase family protein [Cupriavidus pauculus]
MSTISRRSFVQSIGAATLAPGVLVASAEAKAVVESSAPPQRAGADYADYKHILVAQDRGVATVTLNYPPFNLLDEVLSEEFDRVTRQLEQDASVRVVVLQSAVPKFFIAHSGLHRVGSAPKTISNTRTFRLTQMLGERLRNMPKAVIAKVEGIARGGGCEIALAADMCFGAIGKAVFGQPEVVCGLVPGGGNTQRLPRRMGRARALEVLLVGGDFSAELADHYGYINRALPAGELGPFVDNLARRIATFPPTTIAHLKAAVDMGSDASFSEGLLIEAHEADRCVANDAIQARVKAILAAGAETYEGELHFPDLSAKLPPAD